MATYVFRCEEDGVFEVERPMGTAARCELCPSCGRGGARVYAAPRLGLADRGRGALIDRAERTRWEPDVVTAVPPAADRPRRSPAQRRVLANPALRRLPRP